MPSNIIVTWEKKQDKGTIWQNFEENRWSGVRIKLWYFIPGFFFRQNLFRKGRWSRYTDAMLVYDQYTVGTSDFDAQMHGMKFWKVGENLRPAYKQLFSEKWTQKKILPKTIFWANWQNIFLATTFCECTLY